MTRARALQWLARLGYVARGVVHLVLGWLAAAAAAADWDELIGGGAGAGVAEAWAALATLDAAPLGDGPLLAVATGLALYGAFSLVKGGYHRLPPTP